MGGSRRVPLDSRPPLAGPAPVASSEPAQAGQTGRTGRARTDRPGPTKPIKQTERTERMARPGRTDRTDREPAARSPAEAGPLDQPAPGAQRGRPAPAPVASFDRPSPPRGTAAGGNAIAGGHSTYVYCITRSARRPAVPRRVTPLPGSGTPRAIPMSAGHWAIVGDVPRDSFSAAAIERRLGDLDWVSRCGAAHQAVVDACLRHPAVVPMTLFTIFDNDERALTGMRRDKARLDATLDRVAGRHEWVVRVLRAADPADRRAESRGDQRADQRGDPRGGQADGRADPVAAPSGRDFLLAKAQQRQTARRRSQDADDAMRTLAQGLVAIADDVRFRGELEAVGAAAMLDAAFLVPAGIEARFKREARRLAATLTEQGYGVTVTGPWPCYSFVAQTTKEPPRS